MMCMPIFTSDCIVNVWRPGSAHPRAHFKGGLQGKGKEGRERKEGSEGKELLYENPQFLLAWLRHGVRPRQRVIANKIHYTLYLSGQ